ncbi:MAG: metallophosphoesterase [Chloroflexi bacterium]|nr:metallophosphoesterase [Chloroflexota bacterium]MCC6892441.1 metallophosphoesterase [Anaerolineae bacterium]
MTRAVWLTDIHLNFLKPVQIDKFYQLVRASRPNYVLISGDIGEAPQLQWYMQQLESRLPFPIYFVLGNHDYYGASFADVHTLTKGIVSRSQRLHWLTTSGVVELAPDVGLIGHEGWADGRAGDYFTSKVLLSDYLAIRDFVGLDEMQRFKLLNQLGDEAARYIHEWLPKALDKYPQVILLTHVPPFTEACWHEGGISDQEWLPHFVCQAAGEAMVQVMADYPDRQLTVLCGHSHGQGSVQVRDNLRVLTGGAEYGKPQVQQVFEF